MEILLIPEEDAEQSKCSVKQESTGLSYSRMTGSRGSQKHRATLKDISWETCTSYGKFDDLWFCLKNSNLSPANYPFLPSANP